LADHLIANYLLLMVLLISNGGYNKNEAISVKKKNINQYAAFKEEVMSV